MSWWCSVAAAMAVVVFAGRDGRVEVGSMTMREGVGCRMTKVEMGVYGTRSYEATFADLPDSLSVNQYKVFYARSVWNGMAGGEKRTHRLCQVEHWLTCVSKSCVCPLSYN